MMLSRFVEDLCSRYLDGSRAARRLRRRSRPVPSVAALVELLESRELLSATPVVVDNSDAGYSNVRDWLTVAGGLNGSVTAADADEAGALSSWNFTGLENGQYYIQATWTSAADRATNALFTARSSFGATGREFRVNQRVAPAADFLSGTTQFQTLGVITVREGKLLVELTNAGADGKVVADAVRLAPVSATDNSVAARTERLNAITLALFAYHEVHNQFPPTPVPALLDPNGKFLSWRVHLLPFLGYEDLYRQFHLNEPWDSPNNLPLVDQMPDVFRSRDLAAGVGVTGFQRADFPGGFHITGAGGPSLTISPIYYFYNGGGDLSDNPSTSLLLLETAASNAVPWTAADDTPFSPTDPLAFRGPAPSDFSLAAMVDGQVRQISRNIVAADLLALATWSGSEVLSALRIADIFVDPPAPADVVSQTKLQQLMLAMWNYHDVYGRFPAGRWDSSSQNYDANGNPYLSWRVHLLPFIGEEALYKRFNLQERWDSPHNLHAAQDMPELFRSTGMSPGSVTTGFQVFRGPDAYPLLGSPSGYSFYNVTDGMQNTLGIIELPSSSAQNWARPDGDIAFNAANPFDGLGSIPPQGWWVAMMDGSVQRLSAGITAANLKALVTPRGFEVLGPAEWANAFVDFPRAESITERRNKLRSLGLAMHNYHDAFQAFPVVAWLDQMDASGKPNLSWRVHILPYLGHSELYMQFHFNEPWNSPHNLTLLDKMPDDFRSRDLPVGTHFTGFQLLTGPDAYLQQFDPTTGLARGPRIRDLVDGTSNTILVVETQASQAVEWTRPDGDLPFDLSDPLGSLDLTGLKNLPADGVLVLMADGSVRNMRPTISAADFSSYATWRGSASPPLPNDVPSAIRTERSFFDVAGSARSLVPMLDERLESRNELKTLMLGIHNYVDAFIHLPAPPWLPQYYDANGNPELSWRVHILPYLDQASLYNQFHLDEPWDSPNNLPLLDQMPDIFLSRGLSVGTNRTGYQMLTGAAAYDPSIRGSRDIRNITDGTSNTISIIETPPELAVPWTKPDDFPFNPADPFAAIRALVTDYLAVAMFDGSVRSLHPQIAPADAAALITWRNGDTPHYPFGGYYDDDDNFESLTPEIQITDSAGKKYQNEIDVATFPSFAGTPNDKVFNVKNTGSQSLTISAIDLPAGFSLVSALAPIAPGATLALTIRSAVGNTANGLVAIHTNVPHQPVTRFAVKAWFGAITPTIATHAPSGPYTGAPYVATTTLTGIGGVAVSARLEHLYYYGPVATGSVSRSPPTAIGTYTVVVIIEPDSDDYRSILSPPVTFTITPITPTVVATHGGGVYTANKWPASAVVTGSPAGILAGNTTFRYYTGPTATGSFTTTAPANAGVYTVVAVFTSTSGHYSDAISTPLTFEIVPATPTIEITAVGGDYNRNPHPATTRVRGIGYVEVSGITTIRYYAGTVPLGPGTTSPPIDIGTYTAVATFESSDSNYGPVTSVPVVFTIRYAELRNGVPVLENQAPGWIVGQVAAIYRTPGATYSLVPGIRDEDNAKFTIDSQGILRTAAQLDYETREFYYVRIRVTNVSGSFTELDFYLNTQDVAEIAPAQFSIPENRPKGTLVGTLSMPNPAPGRTYAFSLLKGGSASLFAISGNTLTTRAPLEFEGLNVHRILVRATESGTKAIIDQFISINVTDVVERPTGFALSFAAVRENHAVGTAVGAFYLTPRDASHRPTFSLVSGSGATDNARFYIDTTGTLRTAAVFTYSKKFKGYSIRVRAVDASGWSFEQTFQIAVTP